MVRSIPMRMRSAGGALLTALALGLMKKAVGEWSCRSQPNSLEIGLPIISNEKNVNKLNTFESSDLRAEDFMILFQTVVLRALRSMRCLSKKNAAISHLRILKQWKTKIWWNPPKNHKANKEAVFGFLVGTHEGIRTSDLPLRRRTVISKTQKGRALSDHEIVCHSICHSNHPKWNVLSPAVFSRLGLIWKKGSSDLCYMEGEDRGFTARF